MKMQRDTLLGLVFFGGLAMLGWATVNLTSLSLEPRPTETIYFDSAQGLRVGDPVSVLGKRLGQVLEVALVESPDKPPIAVTIELDRPIELTDDARIEIKQTGLLGGQEIAIDPGAPAGPAARRPLVGATRPSAIEALGEADLVGTVDSIKRFFDALTDPDGSVGALLASREVYDDFSAALRNLRQSMERVSRGEGPVGRLLHSEEMADDLSMTVQSLRNVTHKVDEGSGLAARVVNDPELAADVAGAVDDVHTLTSAARRGDGVLGRAFMDADWADDVDATLASLRSTMAKADDPESGLIGAALGDRALREDLAAVLDDIAAATEQVRAGRGLLGKIIFEDELGDQLERVFTQVSGAIEDVREAAPVGTFFQVLATPF